MTRPLSRSRRVVCTGALLLCGAAAASAMGVVGSAIASPIAAGATATCGAGSLELSVQGRGSVTTSPNMLTVDLQVSASAANPGQALQSDETATSAVVSALAAGGLVRRDIQTTDLSVQPTYASTGTVLTGYAADTTVVGKVHQFSSVAQLISQAVAAGGTDTTIQSLSFSVTDPLAAQDQARRAAVRQAAAHAASMASAANQRIGRLCSLKDESSTTSTSPVPFYAGAAARAPAVPAPIQPGTQTVTARVALVYQLVPKTSRHRSGSGRPATAAG